MVLAKKKNQKYTYQDYLTWNDNERWEIIDGEAYNMAPAPTPEHQKVLGECHRILGNKLLGKKCQVFISPIDVVFSEENVVQPDLIIVCDPKKITPAHINGPPDVIIEVLSPSTALKDKKEKKFLYEKFKVKEYFLVYPGEQYIEKFVLKNGRYDEPEIFDIRSSIKLTTIGGFSIPLKNIFPKN